jgi:hypothetical protein
MAYGVDWVALFIHMASQVDCIRKGEYPSDISNTNRPGWSLSSI